MPLDILVGLLVLLVSGVILALVRWRRPDLLKVEAPWFEALSPRAQAVYLWVIFLPLVAVLMWAGYLHVIAAAGLPGIILWGVALALAAVAGVLRWRMSSRSMAWIAYPLWIGGMLLLVFAPLLVLNLGLTWKTYTPADGSYSVMFPGPPYEEDATEPGSEYTDREVGWVSADGATGYWVNVWEYPAGSMADVDPAAVYDSRQAAGIAAVRGTLASAADVSLSGHPGRHYTGHYMGEVGDISLAHRMFLVGDRLYNLYAFATDPDQSATDRFFDSFALGGE